MDDSYQLLLHGVDTVQCAYYRNVSGSSIFNFQEPSVKKEDLRDRKSKFPQMVEIREELYHLFPHGTSSGYL